MTTNVLQKASSEYHRTGKRVIKSCMTEESKGITKCVFNTRMSESELRTVDEMAREVVVLGICET